MATWYVRPDTSHGSTRNGLTYATAWGGWGEVVGASMAATDTLMVCGAFTLGSTISGAKAGSSLTAKFTVDGGYAADPGSFSFANGAFYNVNRDYVSHRNLTMTGGTSSRIFNSKTGVDFTSLTLTGGANGVTFDASNGTAYADVDIVNCTITGQTNAAVNWLVATAAAVSTMTRLTIRGCTMSGQTQDQIIHLRTQSGVSASSIMSGIVIENNTISNAQGVGIRCDHGQLTSSGGGSITIQFNTFSNLSEGASAVGGAMVISGFTGVTVRRNTVRTVVGVYGGCNAIYSTNVDIQNNYVDGCTSSTIDACGALVDHLCDNVKVRYNTFKNCLGKAGVTNSGAGVMVLDAINTEVYGNLIDGCRIGLYLGVANGETQEASLHGNTVVNPTVYGVYLSQYATRADLTVKNNAFVGSVPLVYDNVTGGWTGEDYNAASGMTASTNHTNGANNITTDLLLTADYKPTASSPLLGAGTHLGYTRDIDRKQRPNPPSIGAYDVATLRAA